MTATGSWDASSIASQVGNRFRIGVFDFPVPTDHPEYRQFVRGPMSEAAIGGGLPWAITRQTRHAEVCIDFLRFCTTQANNEKSPPEVPGVLDVGMLKVAESTDYRSWEDRSTNEIHRIANTIADTHAANTAVIPCFALLSGNEWDVTEMGRRAHGGYNDLITLRDQRGSDEQIRLQWGYLDRSRTGLGSQVPSVNWVAPTQTTIQTWQWDRPTDPNDMRRYPSQAFTRAVKFPSGEMPDQILTSNVEKFRFGARFDNAGGTTPAIVDELVFPLLQSPPDDRRDWVFLGQVPAQIFTAPTTSTTTNTTALKFVGIDEKTDTHRALKVMLPDWNGSAGVVRMVG
jgi:hypothetical protein